MDSKRGFPGILAGGFVSGVYSILFIRELNNTRSNTLIRGERDFAVSFTTLMTAASAALLALAINKVQLSNRYMRQAVNHYNWEVNKIGQREVSSIELELTGNGFGLVYKF